MGTAPWTVALYDWARLVFAGPLQEAVVCRAAAAAFLVMAFLDVPSCSLPGGPNAPCHICRRVKGDY